MAKKRVADVLVETLVAAGVKRSGGHEGTNDLAWNRLDRPFSLPSGLSRDQPMRRAQFGRRRWPCRLRRQLRHNV
jgi:hypothetical protein